MAVVLVAWSELNCTQTHWTPCSDYLLICEDPLTLCSECDPLVDGSRVVRAE